MAKRALDGVRIITMGSAWAGPYCGRVMAEHGAEVFRVTPFAQRRARTRSPELLEARKRKLLGIGVPEEIIEKVDMRGPDHRGIHTTQNYGIGIDLSTDKGKELFKKLVVICDVVLVGYSPRVMTNLSLDYPVLREVKPDLIMIHIPGLGMTGPEKDVRMWGTGCEALSGLQSITGYLGGEPHRASGYIVDGLASPYIVTAILAALIYCAETGKGQLIDLAQTETATCLLGEAVMDYSMNKRIAQLIGNRHPSYAPYGCYRCQGDDMWVTIAVTSDEEWRCFCDALGNPEWTKDEKFSDMVSRWKNQGELDKLIEEWTIQHDHYAVQEILQKVGVAAGAVVDMGEHIVFDPQVKDRDIYQWITDLDGNVDPIFRVPWKLPKTPTSLTRTGPYPGQHNDYVFGEVLGMSQEEIAKLTKEEVLGSAPPPSVA